MNQTQKHLASLFRSRTSVAELLKDVCSEHSLSEEELSSLEFVRELEADHDGMCSLLWQITIDEQLVYLLITVLDRIDPAYVIRLIGTMTRLWLQMLEQEPYRSGEPMPPVCPITVYVGAKPWDAPSHPAHVVRPLPPRLQGMPEVVPYA